MKKKKVNNTLKIAADGEQPYFNFNIPADVKENPHFFLSEELFTPKVNSCDTQRLNMFSNHINQTVHLKNAEPPRVFTGFENQIGKYSMAYKKAPKDFTIIAKIPKNELNYTLVVRYRDGVYDCIDINTAVNICEEYGYKLNDCIADRNVGDRVSEEEYIYRSDNYDEYGNFGYGTNLKAAYFTYKNMTYEDAFVISESAAEKLTSYKVEKTQITVNTNDILLNIYSDLNDEYNKNSYHSIPKVGEHTKNNILVASRREESQNILYNFQQERMKSIDTNDMIWYTCGGTIADIDIYANIPLSKLKAKNNEFAQEVAALYEQQFNYYKELATALEIAIPAYTEAEYIATLTPEEKQAYLAERKEYGFYYVRPNITVNKFTDELAYKWKYAHEFIDERISWRSDGKRYDNLKIMFTILKEDKLEVGVKASGRYGNKGVCAMIVPDAEMPYDPVTNTRVDICLNPLGVVNRNNPAQMYEQYVNFIADHVVREMKKCDSYDEMEELYLDYLAGVNPQQYEYVEIELLTMNRKQKHEYLDSILENGISTHVPPFVGNVEIEDFVEIFKDHPEWVEEYKCEGIERPLVIGDEYFIRLKHQSGNKSSIRSKGMLNIKNMPSKSALKKEKKALINDNPIRNGEMETNYLQITKRPDLVTKLLRTYSTSMDDRQQLVEDLLLSKDPLNINVRVSEGKSITREILDNYLAVLEVKLED